jgi:hypothetical protein
MKLRRVRINVQSVPTVSMVASVAVTSGMLATVRTTDDGKLRSTDDAKPRTLDK